MKYRVTVNRLIHDVQWRHVDIEADSVEAAEAEALRQANINAGFWDDAKSEPVESDSAQIDDETKPVEAEPMTERSNDETA